MLAGPSSPFSMRSTTEASSGTMNPFDAGEPAFVGLPFTGMVEETTIRPLAGGPLLVKVPRNGFVGGVK